MMRLFIHSFDLRSPLYPGYGVYPGNTVRETPIHRRAPFTHTHTHSLYFEMTTPPSAPPIHPTMMLLTILYAF